MLSTAFEVAGLTIITAAVTVGSLLLASAGVAVLAGGTVAGLSLLFVGWGLERPASSQNGR